MKRLRLITLMGLVALLVLAALLTVAPPVTAQSGGGYDLTWNTVDGGGGTSTGGGYTLTGTIGQADAGNQSGGSYTAATGFWAAFAETMYRLFLPLATR